MPSCTELEMPKFNLSTLVGSNKPGSDMRLAGPWFNIKMSYQYRKSHCGDKTVARSSYLHNGISYTGKMTSLYWIRALTFKKFMQSVEKNQTEKLHSDHRICNCDPKSTFCLHVSLFSCLTAWKKTFNLEFDSCVRAVKILTILIFKTAWLDPIQHSGNQSTLWAEISGER